MMPVTGHDELPDHGGLEGEKHDLDWDFIGTAPARHGRWF
jgi:hypothetical protein